jgi:hypothetical protein
MSRGTATRLNSMHKNAVYSYIFRSYVASSDLCNFDAVTVDEAFVLCMKQLLHDQLKIFGTPVEWHSRWHVGNATYSIRSLTVPRSTSFKVKNVYFDFECWNGPNSAYLTTGAAIANSIVFIAHISVDSISNLAAIRPSLGRDWVSPFLLEMTIALFLFYTRQGSVRVIIPLVSSELSQGPASFDDSRPYELLSGICDELSEATSSQAANILRALGFATETNVGGAILRGSVRETLLLLLRPNEKVQVIADAMVASSRFEAPCGRKPQPIFTGRGDGAAAAAADQVVRVLRAALRAACEERMWELEKYSATAAELMRWLDAAGLQAYKIPCAVAGVDSLHRLVHPSALPRIAWAAADSDVSSADCGALPGRAARRPVVEFCNAGNLVMPAKELFGAGMTAGSMESLAEAVAELARDPRAQSLLKRVEDFRDRQANGLVALMTPNAIETGILSAQTQACAAAMGFAQLLLGSYLIHFMLNPETR